MADPTDVEKLAAEVAASNFKNKHLNRRLSSIVIGLARDPGLSLPRAFDSAGLEAAYRFFSNHSVRPAEILAGHFDATRGRTREAGDFLVAHDSTTFSYRYDGDREGLGRAKRGNLRSNQQFFAHISLAISADEAHRPLGVAAFKTWSRLQEPSGMEYQRWEEQIKASSLQLDSREHAVHLADREADDYEMFYALKRDGHRFVVRCLNNRWLDEEPKVKLRDRFANVSASFERDVALSRRTERPTDRLRKTHPTRAKRMATLKIAAIEVALKKPMTYRAHTNHPPTSLAINVVRVWEPDPPAGEAPIEWYLYTTDPIDTLEQQLKIVDYYRARWVIEEYFKALKTGCDFESRQLQDYESLINLLAVFATIAYHLLLIRSEAARAPDQPALELGLVSEEQVEVLRALGRRQISAIPTAREIYLAIAALGGHIKYAGNPGWLTLSRGHEKLATLTEGWRAAKLQLSSDQR
jgi:hypothetical protein